MIQVLTITFSSEKNLALSLNNQASHQALKAGRKVVQHNFPFRTKKQ